jgi:WD40 repeat protein
VAVSFSPDNQTYAYITKDNQIQLQDLSNNGILQTFSYTNENPPLSLTFSSDSKQLAVSMKTEVQIWEIEKKQLFKSFLVDDLYLYNAKTMTFSHDDSLLALNAGNNLRIWDIQTGEIVTNTELEHYRFYAGHIIFSPGDNLIALFNGYLHIWDLESEELVALIPNGSDSFSFNTDGTELVSIKRNEVFRWRMPDGELIDKFTMEDRLPLLTVLPPNANEIVGFTFERSSSNEENPQDQRFDFYISLWRVEDWEMIWRIPTNDLEMDEFGYLVASPTGDWVAMIGISNGFDIWQIK